MIILINGAPGSGKTKTAEYLFLNTPQSAWIDGDVMLGINPQKRTDDELELREKNIAAVAKNYNEFGYKTIYISFVYMKSEYLSKQLELLKSIDDVKIIALITNEETLRERHANDTYKRVSIDDSIDINNKIMALHADEIIDNSHLTIEEIGAHLKKTYGLA